MRLDFDAMREAVDSDAFPDWEQATRERDLPAVYRCAGCERIYDRALERRPDGDEYDEPRCPYCGTRKDNDETEVGRVEF